MSGKVLCPKKNLYFNLTSEEAEEKLRELEGKSWAQASITAQRNVGNKSTKPKKLTLKTFKNLIKKEQSKRLFLFGLTLILTSYFVPIKAYYITFGGIFLSLSLICRLYGSTTQNND